MPPTDNRNGRKLVRFFMAALVLGYCGLSRAEHDGKAKGFRPEAAANKVGLERTDFEAVRDRYNEAVTQSTKGESTHLLSLLRNPDSFKLSCTESKGHPYRTQYRRYATTASIEKGSLIVRRNWGRQTFLNGRID